MQVDPINPTLKPPGTKLLKLKYDEPLSKIAFKFNLRRYSKEPARQGWQIIGYYGGGAGDRGGLPWGHPGGGGEGDGGGPGRRGYIY